MVYLGFLTFIWHMYGIKGFTLIYMGFLTFYVEYTWNMCIYIYVEYVRNVKYGLYRVSQFYLECK